MYYLKLKKQGLSREILPRSLSRATNYLNEWPCGCMSFTHLANLAESSKFFWSLLNLDFSSNLKGGPMPPLDFVKGGQKNFKGGQCPP